jgi:prevent-host-death family protein
MVIMTITSKERTMPSVSVAEAKSHFSDLVARSEHGRERFIITRRDKPVAALVSLEDLRVIEQYRERQGLAAIAGRWPGFAEVAEAIGDIDDLRQKGGGGRNVSV